MDSRLKLIINGDPEEVQMLLIRLKEPGDTVPFCQVITRFNDIITCRVKRKHLLEVYNSPLTFSVKAPRLIPATRYGNEESESSSGELTNPSRHFETSYTGKGIYSAFVDWGFDIAHVNLRKPDGTTRFKCIWDQNAPYDGNKYGYGHVYSYDDINYALSTATPYTTLGYHPGRQDVFGNGMHGTHVVDIAAGTPVVGEGGVATETMLIGVQLGNNFVNGSDLALGDSVRLNEALDFIHANTTDAPCVINMSLGSQGDSHTGKSLVELSLDNFLSQNPGYAIVQSVGNYYSAHCHLQHTLLQSETYNIEWNIPRRHLSPSEVEIWYPGEDQFSVKLIAPNGDIVADTNPFDDIRISYRNQPVGYIFHRSHEPNTGLNHIDIILDVSVLKGKWLIEVTGTVVSKGFFHAYSERNDVSQAKFSPHQSSPFTTTGSICNGKHSITAGAYDHRNPSRPIVSFSSSGPTADGQMKPDVLAPGFKISAAKSAPSLSLTPINDLTVKSGSSMAAPHVAGVLALLFQKFLPERLSIEKTKQLLFQSLDPLPDMLSAGERIRAGNGFLNIRKLLNTNNVTMQTSYLTRPVRRSQTEVEDYPEQEHHAPYLHEDCLQCENALLENIEQGAFENEPDLLSLVHPSSFSKEKINLFDVYRHFHPSYSFNYSPYEYKFIPVALPGKRLTDSLRTGDIVITRTVLGSKNYGGIITNPQPAADDITNSSPGKKKGIYIEIYGSADNIQNKKSHLRIADHNHIVPGNMLIVRTNNNEAEGISEYSSDSGEDILNTGIPGLTGINIPDWSNTPPISFPNTNAGNNSGNTTIDPNDPATDVRAKFSLQRMLRQDGDAAADAAGMIGAMKANQLFGIYGDDLAISADIAKQKHTQRWLLVPAGKDADIIPSNFNNPPVMIFRDGIEKNSARMDAALRNAWHSFVPVQTTIPPKTGGEIPGGNNIPNVVPVIPLLNNILTGSVGKGGQNNPADVSKIQQLLTAAGINIPVTGRADNKEGDTTTLAIYHYQKMKRLPVYDGRVDTNGNTLKSLLKDSKKSLQTYQPLPVNQAGIAESEFEDATTQPLLFEWLNMKPVHHPNGYDRIYFVTSGAKGADESCFFPFQITNNMSADGGFGLSDFVFINPVKNYLLNVYAKAQLTRTSGTKQVKWGSGEKQTIWKTVPLTKMIKPGSKAVFGKGIEITSDKLSEARDVDNTDFSARLDLEIYYSIYKPPVYNYILRKTLLFFLVKPVEFVFGDKLKVKPDKKKEQALVESLRQILLTVPTSVKHTFTITNSITEISSEGTTISVTHSNEQTDKQEIGAKIEVPFAKFLELSGSVSTETKRAFSKSYSTEKTFTRDVGKVISDTMEIPPSRSKGRYRHIILEPNLEAIPVEAIFLYSNINESGMAGKIEKIKIPYIYRITSWRVNVDEFVK